MTVTTLPDRPIDQSHDDLLDRRAFAQALADLVLDAPRGHAARIGVYGGWGEGKSSILQLMRLRLKAAGHYCVWFVPWATPTAEAMKYRLTRLIADELSLDLKSVASARAVRKLLKRASNDPGADLRLQLADAFFGEAATSKLDTVIEHQGAALAQSIKEKLGGQKLIIFVDDIDRLVPELAPPLLLTLREALDQPDFFYVLALDPAVVEEGLRSVHSGWGSPGDFLEKVVEIPRYVPEPSPSALAAYVRSLAERVGDSIDIQALSDLTPLLPRNPRRAKLFIRYLANLSSLTDRFSADELDRRAFYLTQLLSLEFPEEARSLRRDAEAIKDLRLGSFRDRSDFLSRTHGSAEERAANRPEAAHIRDDHPRIERFSELCEAIREIGFLSWGRYDVADQLKLPEQPPLFSVTEVARFVDEWLASGEDGRLQATQQLIVSKPGPASEVMTSPRPSVMLCSLPEQRTGKAYPYWS